MLDKMKQLYELQKKAKTIQKELADTEIEARSAGGEVTVVVTGDQKMSSIVFDESVLSPEKKNDLERLTKQVIDEAMSKAQAIAAERTKGVMKDMGVNIPGL